MIETTLHAFMFSSFVGVVACLISESIIAEPIRRLVKGSLVYCPICLSFWLALPALFGGLNAYFLTVGFSNIWMLLTLKVYESIEGEDDNTNN